MVLQPWTDDNLYPYYIAEELIDAPYSFLLGQEPGQKHHRSILADNHFHPARTIVPG